MRSLENLNKEAGLYCMDGGDNRGRNQGSPFHFSNDYLWDPRDLLLIGEGLVEADQMDINGRG